MWFYFLFYSHTFLLKGWQTFTYVSFNIYSKRSWISDIQYGPLDELNSSYHVTTEILMLSFLYECFIFFHVYYMLRFDKTTHLLLLFKFFFQLNNKSMSNILLRSDVLLILEFIIQVFVFLLYFYWVYNILTYFVVLLDTKYIRFIWFH